MGAGNVRGSCGQGAGQGAEETQGQGRLGQLGQPSICASPLYSSFLVALSALPSLACLPRLWALRPALSQLHIPSHRHTWGPSRLEAGCWAPRSSPLQTLSHQPGGLQRCQSLGPAPPRPFPRPLLLR